MLQLDVLSLSIDGPTELLDRLVAQCLRRIESAGKVEEEDALGVAVEVVVQDLVGHTNVDAGDGKVGRDDEVMEEQGLCALNTDPTSE